MAPKPSMLPTMLPMEPSPAPSGLRWVTAPTDGPIADARDTPSEEIGVRGAPRCGDRRPDSS